MRGSVTIFFAAIVLSAVQVQVQAQEQERKLVDRLLKPDMTLQNSAQNKNFLTNGAAVDKHATVGTFYLEQKSNAKNFARIHDFSTRQIASRSFHGDNRRDVSSQNAASNSQMIYPTSSVREVGDAHDSKKSASGRRFAGERPFLDRGKSEKALSRQNPPLTIEQVRELLNKNK